MKRVSSGTLKNGFRFYTQSDDRSHVSGVGVKVGSIHDPPGMRGICHLTEHIVGGYSREAELKFEEYQCGPDEGVNVRTDHYSTFYGHDSLLKREFMFELFDIIAASIRDPQISQKALERERAAVLNEYYLHGIDTMDDLAYVLMHQTMYEKNPARNRIDCEPEDLFRITMDDVRTFVRNYYVPNNMFAVVLGPKFHKAKGLAERWFGDLPARSVPSLAYDLSDTRPRLTGVKMMETERKGIHQYHVAVGFPTNPMGNKDDEVLKVLLHIWRWRLCQALRIENYEWGKGVYRAHTYISRSFAHGMVYAHFATVSEDFARFGVEKIISVCDELKTKWVLTDELITMSNKLYHSYVDDFNNSPGKLAERIIDSACNGDEEMQGLNSFIGRLSRVGKKSLLRVANEYFTTPNFVGVLIKPAAG
ncbi:MAG: pitrilysin family protein [bacterium]|nr:pitrilysin family protein [bacterium]